MVDAARWPDVFDEVLDYRRFPKSTFKVLVRAEIKANYLLRNGGPFRALGVSEAARFRVYRGLMRLQQKLELLAFAVVIRKDQMAAKSITSDPRDIAWEYLFQRLERFTTKGGTHVSLAFDEGEGVLVRKLARKARRAAAREAPSGPDRSSGQPVCYWMTPCQRNLMSRTLFNWPTSMLMLHSANCMHRQRGPYKSFRRLCGMNLETRLSIKSTL